MKWNKKEIIAAALLICLSGPALAEEARPAESGVLIAAEEMAETRRVQFIVREDTAIEVDGEILKGPSEVRGTTWFYDVPELKLGRHHVKLTHPRTNSWQGVLVVTKDYPGTLDGYWDLSTKLDYGHFQKKEECVKEKKETEQQKENQKEQAGDFVVGSR